jgi:hypothetical protein
MKGDVYEVQMVVHSEKSSVESENARRVAQRSDVCRCCDVG